ncbi:acyltransferase family protein [Pedobacter sp. 22226]|uniref:acyltransferase family protein n=1 Tax=Pedobacter sp. 22226 TaxID=3453894 RepID=UPI003F8549F3
MDKVLSFLTAPTKIPDQLNNKYYHSLNGFRGLAITMVVLSHLKLSDLEIYYIIFSGKLGVLIFFVLSGFLITTLMLKEKISTNRISLKNFLIRRILRIFPVAYLFLGSLLILNYYYELGISKLNFIGAALYITNLTSIFRVHGLSWFVGHFWSLSVEEQFYLLFPALLKFKFRFFFLTILTVVFLLPIFIGLQETIPLLSSPIFYSLTHYSIKFQPIAVGCLFAILWFKYPSFKFPGMGNKDLINLVGFAFIVLIRYDNFFSLKNILVGLITSFVIGLLIVINITKSNGITFKFLNNKVITTIGIYSYSIYIWQQPFTAKDYKLPVIFTAPHLTIIGIAAISYLSYNYYEKYFIKLKSKFSPKTTMHPSTVK